MVENATFVVDNHGQKNDIPDIEPITPLMVQLLRASDADGGHNLMARLREPFILKSLRLFQHQPIGVFFEGYTKTSNKLALASEGIR